MPLDSNTPGSSRRTSAAGVALIALCCATIPLSGQSGGTTTASQPYAPPRTADGQPDLQGIWMPAGTFYNIQDLEYQAVYQTFAESDPAQRGKSLVIDPPDGKIPYQPWALEKSNLVLKKIGRAHV